MAGFASSAVLTFTACASSVGVDRLRGRIPGNRRDTALTNHVCGVPTTQHLFKERTSTAKLGVSEATKRLNDGMRAACFNRGLRAPRTPVALGDSDARLRW